MSTINQLFDFFLPRFCNSCRNKLSTKELFLCEYCISTIKRADSELLNHEFNRKFYKDKIISDFTSLYIFQKDQALQNLVHNLKYNGSFRVGIFLGKLIGKELQNTINKWNANLILPVPLHHLKKAERGYNQSYYICKGIQKYSNAKVYTSIIQRKRYTESQTTMDLRERKNNIENAFQISKSAMVKSKRIIVVDDVITTGATITECGKLLLDEGADMVFALSLAIAE